MDGETNLISQEQRDIQNWLTSQKEKNTSVRKNQIEELTKKLLFAELWVEKNAELKFIIVPTSKLYKFSNNKENEVSNYFVCAINKSNKILYSVVIQNRPLNKQNSTNIKYGNISNVLNGEVVKEDCNVRLITIYDYYLYEKNYRNNTLISTLNLEKKPTANSIPDKNNEVSSLTGCLNWYWVTTYPDGTQTWEFLYTTCGNCSMPNPNEMTVLCESGEGGGNTEPDLGTIVTRNVTYTVKEFQGGIEYWRIVGAFKITGNKFNDITKNMFTSIVADGNSGCTAFLNFQPAYSGLSYMPGYIVYTEISHSNNLSSPYVAFASVTANLNFPNWSFPRNQTYTEPHIWHASTDLF